MSLKDNYNIFLFKDNLSMDNILNTKQTELDSLDKIQLRAYANNIPWIADIWGIARFEELLGIIANPSTETLEYRRGRIINNLAMGQGFTRLRLLSILNSIFGPENIELFVDYNEYTIFLNVWTQVPRLLTDTLRTLRIMIPANMILLSSSIVEKEVENINVLVVPHVQFGKIFISNPMVWEEPEPDYWYVIGNNFAIPNDGEEANNLTEEYIIEHANLQVVNRNSNSQSKVPEIEFLPIWQWCARIDMDISCFEMESLQAIHDATERMGGLGAYFLGLGIAGGIGWIACIAKPKGITENYDTLEIVVTVSSEED